MKNNRQNIIIAVCLMLVAVVARVVSAKFNLYDLATVEALGLFCGVVIKDLRYALVVALLGRLFGDMYFYLVPTTATNGFLITGFYPAIEQTFTYGGMLLITVLGSTMKQPKALKILGYSVAGSAIFFIVSNFGVWLSIKTGTQVDMFGYRNGWTGFWNSYVMAWPFFKKSILCDVSGSVLLFGAYYLLQQAVAGKMQKARA